jgi:hypothetical protein
VLQHSQVSIAATGGGTLLIIAMTSAGKPWHYRVRILECLAPSSGVMRRVRKDRATHSDQKTTGGYNRENCMEIFGFRE